MTGLSTFLQIIWIASVALQAIILFLVLFRRHYRTLPMFAWYVSLNFAQAFLLFWVYSHFGFASQSAFHIYWWSEVIIMIVQTLASTEIVRRALQDYPGIWELAWRLILCGVLVIVAYSWYTANSKDAWGLMTADRGYRFVFAVAFISCLLLIRHYSISIDPVYKTLLGGFCFYSCGVIIADTLLKAQFLEHFPSYAEVWNESELLLFVGVLAIWIVALRQPVRVFAKPRDSSGDGAAYYDQLAPQLNAQLRELNDTLRKFFGKRATQP